MSSTSIPEKRARSNSFSDSFEISDLTFPPTPPLHKQPRTKSILKNSTNSQSTSSSGVSRGSVIWNKSSSSRLVHDPASSAATSAPPDFSSSQVSSVPLDFSALDSSGHSWSPSSSSFQDTSGATLNDSTASKRPRYLSPTSTSRDSCYPRPLATSQYSSHPGTHTTTTLPSVPGYGPIRLTVTMDLPNIMPAQQHYQRHNSDFTPFAAPPRVDTPLSGTSTDSQLGGSLDAVLGSMSAHELRQLLRTAVQKFPSLASDISSQYTPIAPVEHNNTVSFIHHSNNVWHALNANRPGDISTHPSTPTTAIYQVAQDIETIAQQIHPSSSLATKKNALETLRKIGRNICMAPGATGAKAREILGNDGSFVGAVMGVVQKLTRHDRRTLWAGGSGAEIVKRFEQLDELRRCHGVFEGFEGVIWVLKKEEDELEG